MKKYLELSLVMITGWLVSCASEGNYGPQGPSGWGPMMHYAKGEIAREEYERMKKDLEG